MDYTSIQRNRPLPRATQPGCFVGCQLQDSLHYCLDSINNIPYTTAIDTAGCCSQVNDAAKQLQFCVAKRCTELSDSIQSATSHCKFQTAVPDATPSQSNNPITASPVQQPPPTTPASQPTTPSGSPSAAEPPSGAPTTMYPESSSVTLSRPDRLDTSTLPVIGIPSSSATWAQVPGAATVETAQAANGAGNTYHTFTSWYTGLAKPTITNTGFRAAQHGTHFPFAAIASAVGGAVLFFALLTALYLYVRRLKRRRASAQSTISQKSAIILGVDEAPNSSSEMLYTQTSYSLLDVALLSKTSLSCDTALRRGPPSVPPCILPRAKASNTGMTLTCVRSARTALTFCPRRTASCGAQSEIHVGLTKTLRDPC
ncbi:hypothetical protein C8Q73DRAFT_189510 [Cubamyces lactineus]|nr:hypothetical protein C8Q73DRAFT_189510 [Cubamyces lactineus]